MGEAIDQVIEQDPKQRKVSISQAVKAMVLNGLGFVNQRLYLVPKFFENKPTQRLVGPGIAAEHLNDDYLGRALDALYETGVTPLFAQLSHQAAQRLRLAPRFGYLDSSSFHVDGQYNSEAERGCKPKPPKIPLLQVESRHDHIQVDDLSGAAERVVSVQMDVSPRRW